MTHANSEPLTKKTRERGKIWKRSSRDMERLRKTQRRQGGKAATGLWGKRRKSKAPRSPKTSALKDKEECSLEKRPQLNPLTRNRLNKNEGRVTAAENEKP